MEWCCWCAGHDTIAAAACTYSFSIGMGSNDNVGGSIVENAVVFAAVIIRQCIIVGLDTDPTWVVHKVVIIADADVVVVVTGIVAGVVVVTADVVSVASNVAVNAHWLAFNVTDRVDVVVAGKPHLLMLHCWAHIAVICACGIGLILHLAAVSLASVVSVVSDVLDNAVAKYKGGDGMSL